MLSPSEHVPEEASLLGDTANIQLTVGHPVVRCLTTDGTLGEVSTVETEHGTVTISCRGEPSRPTILLYHDLGLNHTANFQSFLSYPDMASLAATFRIVCVNAPGQEEGADTLPASYVYPSMEQLADTVERVREHVGLRSFIGFGVGMGANVLARYALRYPQSVDALVLINCSAAAPGWIEWGYQKLNVRHLRQQAVTTQIVEYLLWHHFGKADQCNQDVVAAFRSHFSHGVNASNLGALIQCYIGRTDLGIVRELDPHKKMETRMLRCPVLNITSNHSAHIEDSVALNARLDPSTSNWMKVQDCGLVLEEAPGKVLEALRLFLQGLGHVGTSRRASSVSEKAIHDRRVKNRHNSLPAITGVSKLASDFSTPKLQPTSERDEEDTESQKTAATNASTNESKEKIPEGGAKKDVTANEKGAEEDESDAPDDMRITENPWER